MTGSTVRYYTATFAYGTVIPYVCRPLTIIPAGAVAFAPSAPLGPVAARSILAAGRLLFQGALAVFLSRLRALGARRAVAGAHAGLSSRAALAIARRPAAPLAKIAL